MDNIANKQPEPENKKEEILPKYDNPFRAVDEDDQQNSDCIDEERSFHEDEDLWLMNQEF